MANPKLVKSFVAEAAVLPCRVVKLGAADGQVVQSAAAGDAHIGVANELGQASINGRVDVVMEGIACAEAGASITRGALLSVDSSGRVITAAASAGVNVRTIGVALVSASTGDIIDIRLELGSFQG